MGYLYLYLTCLELGDLVRGSICSQPEQSARDARAGFIVHVMHSREFAMLT